MQIIYDKIKEFNVITTVHENPALGGQVVKTFKNDRDAMNFVVNLMQKKKNIKAIRFKKTGDGHNAKWKKQ